MRYDSWRGAGDSAEALRAAGAATMASASTLAAWLTRRGLVGADEAVDDTVRLLGLVRARPPAWQAKLAAALAARLRGRGPSYQLTAILVRETGITPPTDDGFITAWVAAAADGIQTTPVTRVRTMRESAEMRGMAEVLSADPLFDALLPRLFHAQGVGEVLQWESDPADPDGWLGGLRTLCERGRVDRSMLLDGCVGRFLRGGTALELRFFVRLHQALAPDPAELDRHAVDYLRLLPAAPGTVAELALGHVRELPVPAELAEAVEALMMRPEKKLVRAGLSWIDQLARLAPDRLAETSAALALAFSHESSDLQDRAVRLTLKHSTRLDLAPILEAIPHLPRDLRARLDGLASPHLDPGGEPAAEDAVVLVAPVLPQAELLPPIHTVDELAAEFGRAAAPFGHPGWLPVERLLAGLVELAHRDREAVRAALIPPPQDASVYPTDPMTWLWMTLRAVLGDRPSPPALPGPDTISAPHVMVLRRMAEVLDAALSDTLPPVLLATPTSASGHVDPAVLVDRLHRVEAAGGTPLDADLQQALLRIPRTAMPPVDARLTSPAGRLVARWLGGEEAVPVVTVRHRYNDGAAERWFDDGPPRYSCGDPRVVPFVSAPPTGLDLIDLLFSDPRMYLRAGGGCLDWWPGVLPSHREVAAGYLLQHYSWDWPERSPNREHLVRLAGAEGPLGAASAVMLAFHLNDEDPAGRTAALEVLLALAAGGALPGAELGEQLGRLVRQEMVTLSRVLPSLTEAARLGAGRQVWEVVAAAIPHLVPAEGERAKSGLADLLALGVATVPPGADEPIPGLAGLAARKGSSRMVREAARLVQVLG